MKVLIVGGGGREHALAWKIAQSPRVERVFIAPATPAPKPRAKTSISRPTDFPPLINFAKQNESI